MDIKQLKTFIRVAETGSLSKASDRLRLAQPALSRHIRLLEAEIGVELFTRHGRGMEPTDAGLELLDRVSGLVTQLENSIEDIKHASERPRGQVSIGLLPTAGPMLAARIATRVLEEYPAITLRIVEAFAGHLIDWLQRGEIDLAILPGPGVDLHLRTIGLVYESYVLIGPRDCALSPDKPVTVADLASMDLILSSAHHGMRHVLDVAARKARVKIKPRLEVDSGGLVVSMVEAGLGYTVGTVAPMIQEIESGRFCFAPIERPTITRQLLLALPKSRPDTRATTAVKDLVLHETAELVTNGIWKATPDSDLLAAVERMPAKRRRVAAAD